MVLRARPVRRAISRMDSCSRKAQRLMTLSVATSITPIAPATKSSRLGFLRGSDLDGNYRAKWVSSGWKSTGFLLDALFCHCEGYPFSFEESFDTYCRWVRDNEQGGGLLFLDSRMTLGDQQ